ncbi:MAG: hypothetical protein JWP12_894 [Bacteroidetes bacterium]|nr:hypothetical protein [Bacteroidota bacterium]
MPEILSKINALALLSEEGNPDECLMCRINATAAYKLWEDGHSIVFLSEYPRFWGHIIVSAKQHVETFTALNDETHTALFRNAHTAAKMLEQLLKPSRCYVASIGSEQNLLNTCPHIHIHVIPVADKSLKPSEVFTWENGIFSGSKKEWQKLHYSIKSMLPTV